MDNCDVPTPRGLYSDGKHWIYYKIEMNPSVIKDICEEINIKQSTNVILEITHITMRDFSRVSESEMIKLMKKFLSPYVHGKTPIVWELGVDHDPRLTLDRRRMFLRKQEEIAYACGFRRVIPNSTEVTNKYYYCA